MKKKYCFYASLFFILLFNFLGFHLISVNETKEAPVSSFTSVVFNVKTFETDAVQQKHEYIQQSKFKQKKIVYRSSNTLISNLHPKVIFVAIYSLLVFWVCYFLSVSRVFTYSISPRAP